MSSTRSAPAARASNTWYGVAMKSLRSTGSVDCGAHRLEVGEAPLNRRPSVSTLIALRAALLVQRGLERPDRGSAARSPRDGLARLTSAMILTRSAGAQDGECVERRPAGRAPPLDRGERPLGGARLGILHRAGREVGEHASITGARSARVFNALSA